MKILIVLNYPLHKQSGIISAVVELVANLKNEGFEVDVVSTHGRIFFRLKSIWNIFCKARQYDVVFGTGCAWYGFLPVLVGFFAGRVNRKTTIIDFHEGSETFLKRYAWLIKLIFGNTAVVVASGYLFTIFKRYRFNVYCIPYHFHFESFPKRNIPFSWNKKFLWVGTFHHIYDPETALRACHLVLGKRTDIEFDFFGKGPLLEFLQKKYKHPKIRLNGFLSRNELLKRYQEYPALINTSFADNFPVRLVEAGYYKLLVITAKFAGIASTYNEKECLFFEPHDERTLAEHILAVLEDPLRYDPLRMNMYAKVINLTWERVREDWLKLIKTK